MFFFQHHYSTQYIDVTTIRPDLCFFDYMQARTAKRLRSTWHPLIASPIMMQNPRTRRQTGREMPSEERRTRLARLPASAADTAQSAAPPSRSARNERSSNAVVGGEIDRGHVYTDEEGLRSGSHCQYWPFRYAACNTCMLPHTGNADFAMGRKTRELRYFDTS